MARACVGVLFGSKNLQKGLVPDAEASLVDADGEGDRLVPTDPQSPPPACEGPTPELR